MAADSFGTYKGLYDESKFAELIATKEGLYWLKVRSIGRPKLLTAFAKKALIDVSTVLAQKRGAAERLMKCIFDAHPDEETLVAFIHATYKAERKLRAGGEEQLISELYRMTDFSWGGIFENSLDKTIVNRYVKKIQKWDTLNKAIDEKIYPSMRGYVLASWYNHWTSIIIEDIFKDHRAVLPTVGLIKQVDFFVDQVPFDLKVTYFPGGYMEVKRKEKGLRPEATELKKFARDHKFFFDSSAPPKVQFAELFAKLRDHPSAEAKAFMKSFLEQRRSIIDEAVRNPQQLMVWLYENQGERRFDASNRFFLILGERNDPYEGWKLKRNHALLAKEIDRHLDSLAKQPRDRLKIDFRWKGTKYFAYADALFVFQ